MLRIGGQRIPFITVLLMLSESAVMIVVLGLATAVRFSPEAPTEAFSTWHNFLRFALVVLVCVLCLYYYDLYDLQRTTRKTLLFLSLLQAFGVACIVLALIYFVQPELSLGRGVAAIAAPVLMVIVFGWRLLVLAGAPFFTRPQRLLVLGTGAAGIALVQELQNRPEFFNVKVLGFLVETPDTPKAAAATAGADSSHGEPGSQIPATATRVISPVADALPGPVVGFATDLKQVVERENVDRVVLSLTERRGRMPIRELLWLKFAGIRVEDAHTAFEHVSGRILLEHLNPSWLIMSDGFDKSRWLIALKRLGDIAIAAVGIVVSAPFMALVALAIWLEDGAPVLFRQERVGCKGKVFQILKFRSMRSNSGDQRSWTVKGDSRITRVGRVIRKTRLDELPQFFNVLRGDMSLVGPRPEQPYFCQILEEQIPYYGQRHCVRPGITGWAQVKYGYGASIEETKRKLEHDLFYIKHMSLTLDLVILFETAKVMLTRRGAN